MPDPTQLLLDDLTEKYTDAPALPAFLRLYDTDVQLGRMFANLHQQLNEHFAMINGRIRTTRHYWADNSREMIELIAEVSETLQELRDAGIPVEISEDYAERLRQCSAWLSPSHGSSIPEDFAEIKLLKYKPAFYRSELAPLTKRQLPGQKLRMVGEGSYAIVYTYEDPAYGTQIALKRAKKNLSERDLYRFRQEFSTLKSLSFPYIVEVYQYDEARNEYSMEYCDTTLRAYISKNNSSLPFATRKRIALQFLYGVNYIHHKNLLHRDISLQNALVKTFDAGAVLVKLSDFGLVKAQTSTFTQTKTEMRGTIRDPYLHNFKDYSLPNEVYAIGWVISYIFTGRESLKADDSELGRIIKKCTASNIRERYQTVSEVISDIEGLSVLSGAVAPV